MKRRNTLILFNTLITCYINLDSRTDIKLLVEYVRLGCSMSRIRVLMMPKERNLDYVVILEDDIHFKKPRFFNEHLKKDITYDYDVLLIAGNIRPPITPTYNPNPFRVQNSYTTTGYIVKNHYYDKVIHNYKMGHYEIDVFWDTLQQKDNWFIIMPIFCTRWNIGIIQSRCGRGNPII